MTWGATPIRRGTRHAGEFCWVDVLTPEPHLALGFFGSLLGWSYHEIPGMGHEVLVDGCSIGVLFDFGVERAPSGQRPLIGVTVKVDGADEARDRVIALGGSAGPAFDVGDEGRMAVCTDPGGATFDVWEARASHGTEAPTDAHGVPSWFEIVTRDVDRTARFYADLFGWTPEPRPPGLGSLAAPPATAGVRPGSPNSVSVTQFSPSEFSN